MWSYIKKAINSDFTTEPLNVKTDRIQGKVDTLLGSSVYGTGFATIFTTVNVWYTIVDITDSGMLKRVSAIAYNGVGNLEVMITVDGTPRTYSGQIQASVTGVFDTEPHLLFLSEIKFNTSLKVEVRDTNNTDDRVAGYVDYTLD